uniref:Uncharacterized protein n=1 Tax=Aegilops tauschii TaxID=37682 RepID=M8BAN2_AEGTA
MELVSCIAMCLWLAFLLPSHVAATAPTGMVERETKQQILASIPPHWEENPVLFLTSPSGKYAAYFMRSQTAPGAGGLRADFCYVEVLDTTAPGAEGWSVWESECLAVSTVNTCALVFSWKGLEVFDGSNPVSHTHDTESDDNNFLKTLQLVDEGDMRILDKGGELAWKASDEPRAAQHCGMPGLEIERSLKGMEKTIPEVYPMLKSAEVEIKKEHQVLMVNKTTSFKKGKGKKNFKKDGKGVAAPDKPVAGKKPKHGPKPETECFYCKGNGH